MQREDCINHEPEWTVTFEAQTVYDKSESGAKSYLARVRFPTDVDEATKTGGYQCLEELECTPGCPKYEKG